MNAKENGPLVSIIVPIYKVEQYLPKCIDSIINQTYKNIEIILVDDGSPDACGHLCDKYALEDRRINVIHKNNGGLVSARKAGLLASRGQYVQYIDGDDWVEQDLIANMVNLVNQYHCQLVIYNFVKEYPDKKVNEQQFFKEGYYNRNSIEDSILEKFIFNGTFYQPGIVPSVWGGFFLRDGLLKFQCQVDDGIRLGEDACVKYPFIYECTSLYITNEIYYHYRINGNSMSNAFDQNEVVNNMKMLHYLLPSFDEANQIIRKQIDAYASFIFLHTIANNSKPGLKKGIIKRYNQLLEMKDTFAIDERISNIYGNLNNKYKLFARLISTNCGFFVMFLLLSARNGIRSIL